MKPCDEIPRQFQSLIPDPIDVVRQLLQNPDAPQSVRLKAAKLILTTATRSGDDEPSSKPDGPHLVPRSRGAKPERVA